MTAARKPLRIPFLAKVLIPVIGLLILLPVLTIWIVDRHVHEQAASEATHALAMANAVFRNSLEIRDRNLITRYRAAVNEPRFKAVSQLGDAPTMTAFLREWLEEGDPETEIMLFSNYDEPIMAGVRRHTQVDLGRFHGKVTDLIQNALAGETVDAIVTLDGKIFNVISVPAFINDRGQLAGALTIGVRLGESAVQELRSLTQTEVLLMADGRIAVGTLNDDRIRKDLSATDWTTGRRNLASHAGTLAIQLGDEHFFLLNGSFDQPQSESNLSYILLSSYDRRLQALRRTRSLFIMVSLSGIILSAALVWFLIYRATRPLRTLRDGAEAVGRGDFSTRIKRYSNDECGDLAESFNRMTDNLQTSRDELEQTVNTLRSTQDQLVLRESRLRESEEELRLIIESARDHAIVTFDLTGRVMRWNPAAESLLGYRTAEATGLPYATFFTPADRQSGRPESLLESTSSDDGRQTYEGWRVRRDGTCFWADITLSRLPGSKGADGPAYVEITRDITLRKEAEEALKKGRDAAESANRAKTEFLANMSHEIRTPMNAIIGMSSLLKDQDMPGDQGEMVETIRTSAEGLLDIIDDILDISKIEAGHIETRPSECALSECLEHVMDLFAKACEDKGITLGLVMAPDLPPAITVDQKRLRQVLVNLVGNAVKFTPHGGVTLTVNRDPDTSEDHIRFYVDDTGIGIPADQIGQVFEPFFQVDSSSTRRYGGTGLGLTISKKLVQILDGKIAAESVPGRGSRFTFTARAPQVDLDEPTSRNLPGENGKHQVLILSDDPVLAAQLETQFGMWAFRVRTSALDAGSIASISNLAGFDLIVIDSTGSPSATDPLPQTLRAQITPSSPNLLVIGNREPAVDQSADNQMVLARPIKADRLRTAVGKLLQIATSQARPFSPSVDEESGPTTHPMKLLVVEDNPINTRVITMVLRKLGHEPDSAKNGLEGLQKMLEGDYDAVFMDLQMPEMDGLEATRKFREKVPLTQRPYIMALTANAREEDRDACRTAGMHDFVSKPAQLEKISRALERAQAWMVVAAPAE